MESLYEHTFSNMDLDLGLDFDWTILMAWLCLNLNHFTLGLAVYLGLLSCERWTSSLVSSFFLAFKRVFFSKKCSVCSSIPHSFNVSLFLLIMIILRIMLPPLCLKIGTVCSGWCVVEVLRIFGTYVCSCIIFYRQLNWYLKAIAYPGFCWDLSD